MTVQCELPPPAPEDKRLGVTLLSGFLGSGKTTLLSNILKSKDHGLRCALIVNDMGALNIDAALVKNHKLTQKGEKIIQMQNGCICCTLRADLLEEIANLAEMDAFDYLLIESSGISEPIQVAETFTTEFADSVADSSVEEILEGLPADATAETNDESRRKLAELIKNGGLSKVARLDTCVSVVDCTTFMGDFDTTDFLTDRLGEEVDPQDERNITDLLVDQIEFANVVLLNKTDAVSKEVVQKVEGIVKTLNPDAKIFRTTYSRVPLKELLNTRTFDFNKAATGAGWLQSLREVGEWTDSKGVTKKIPKPETEEYGISSFVYAARRPFHPQRLWELMKEPFCILQNAQEEHGEDEWEDEDDNESSVDEADVQMEDAAEDAEGEEEEEKEETKAEILARLQAEKEALDLPARIAYKRASPVWSGVLRSKGFAWLATRPTVSGEWSQAGCMWTLNGGSPWMCAVDESMWPTDDPEVVQAIKTDFMGPWGDRRQEIVFIGQNIPQEKLEKELNGALLTDKEWKDWERIMNSSKTEEKKVEALYNKFDDGWEEWSNPLAEIEVEVTDDEAEAEANEVEMSPVKWGKVVGKDRENSRTEHKHAHRIDKQGKVHHDHSHGSAQPAKRAKV